MHDDDDATADLRRWLGEATTPDDAVEGEPSHHRTRPRIALGLLVLAPWALLALLASTGAHGPSPGDRIGGGVRPTAAHQAATAVPSSLPATRRSPTAAATPPTRGGPPAPDVPADVAPTAVRMVRDAVTRTGARTMAVDAAAPEAAEVVSVDTWTVRVHVVVLRGDRHRWRSAAHEVWVAPVGVRDGRAVGLDRPWPVATVDAGQAPTAWDRADVERDVVRAALDDAGIGHDGDLVMQRHPTLPTIVRVTIGGRRRVWVRTGPQPAVVGHRAGERVR